ncbi:hypothetical protein CC1G_00599 [Coprinopsis cinerea okayama7|uniref:C2H2-type domain-containing protein n=1 Tax=Coprinopsis cinerea (strain Okayama-7 / 130 / ATCC MYA-4618 / FGSC 9003) TaxID=240176 RepID=A8N3S8_COPC7|nr:hypothetical protein CC1G_00599 [Coprinopsis cinerea okayama7\|eukprot:XP_001829420.2 hypothetical protein CC1G_00599 [Coprinopsis cinerea okayama7\
MYYDSDSSDECYDCRKCGASFSCGWDLNNHDSNQHAYYCDRCGRSFVNQAALQQHLENSSFHYYCVFCKRDFAEREWYGTHMLEYHERCHTCQIDFRHVDWLHRHYADTPDRHSFCLECKRHFSSPDNLKHHLASGLHQERTIECVAPRCQRRFISLPALLGHYDSGGCSEISRDHMDCFTRSVGGRGYIVADDDTHFYRCPLCDKRFLLFSGVAAHVEGGKCANEEERARVGESIWDILALFQQYH